jgi:cell division protein FtsL
MNRLNAVLLVVLVFSAMAVVTAQHISRQLYIELGREQKLARQLDVDYDKLLLEQSTWGAHSLVERAATTRLDMHLPAPREVQVIAPKGGT